LDNYSFHTFNLMLVLVRYYSGYTELNNYVNRLLDEVTFVRCKDTIIIIIVKGVLQKTRIPLKDMP